MHAIVCQLGARMHYAVPVLFHRRGELAGLFTDLFVGRRLVGAVARGLSPLPWFGHDFKALRGRQHLELPLELVQHFPYLAARYWWKRQRAASASDVTNAYLWVGKAFCGEILRAGLPDADIIYGLNSATKELFQAQQTKGMLRVVEQTLVPRCVQQELMCEEAQRWQVNSPRLQDKWSDAYAEREAVEWELADLIVCGSAFVRAALEKVGVDGGKIHVVPYGTDLPTSSVQVRLGDSRPKTPLRLLFVGNDGLRKGLLYLLEALRGFRKDTVELSVAGDPRLPPELLRKDDDQIQYLGFIDRASMSKVYQQADVFVLPSLCEGSATVVYEAMAYGLPVICTENTGSAVQHGRDGWIVPAGDVSALRQAIETFIEGPGLVETVGRQAYLTAQQHTVTEYGVKLRRAILEARNTRTTGRTPGFRLARCERSDDP